MALLKLLPEQVMENWPDIKTAMLDALPPHAEWTDEAMLRIQEQFLTGEMECWFAIHENIVRAIATTRFAEDLCSGSRHLLIFTLTAHDPNYSETWREGFTTLKKYALSRNCHKIIAYTKYEKFVELAKRFDANSEWRMILLEF